MSEKNTLIIFIKNSILGTLKTRLAASVGDEAALAIYEQLLEKTREVAKKVAVNREVSYNKFIPEQDAWSPDLFEKSIQIEGGLGAKMHNAFEKASKHFNKMVLIGSDCPWIRKDILEAAFEALDTHDTVFGPAEDGGYYLIGLKEADAAIFDGVVWSTDTVLQKNIDNVKAQGMTYHLLETLSDIDYIEDWKRYLAEQ